MKAFYDTVGRLRATLFCTALVVLSTSAAAQTEREADKPPALGKARMNIVFLDDAAEGLPAGKTVRYNHWLEWDARVPTFQKLLHTFIADFHKAEGKKPAPEASLYALEVSAGLKAADRDRHIAEYLQAIADATLRATLVLARSTAGTDQLRLVYVLEADCPPREAAGFLAALAEVAPAVFHGRIGAWFGPFRAPPTIVFDPRADALAPVPADEKARHRWALLEEDAYLLPHYVLHAVATLHEAPLTENAPWLAKRDVEPGTLFELAQTQGRKIQKYDSEIRALRDRGGWWNNVRADIKGGRRNFYGNRLVETLEKIAAQPGGIRNVGDLYTQSPWLKQIATPQVDRVGRWARGGATSFSTTLGGVSSALFAKSAQTTPAIGTGGGSVIPLSLAAGGSLLLGAAWTTGKWNRTHSDFSRDYNNSLRVLGRIAERSGTGSLSDRDIRNLVLSLPEANLNMLGRQNNAIFNTASMRTFGGGNGASPTDPNFGGILFDRDNEYRVDLSGRLAREISEDRRQGRATGGLGMGRIRYFDDLPLLWLDVAAPRNGSLPVAVPRFLTAADAKVPASFGGTWSFEPLTLKIRRSKDGRRLLRATVTPAETQTRVSYMPLNPVVKDAPSVWVIRNGTGFEPYLGMSEDGRFVWVLRHGVGIEFGEDGLVSAIRSPHGEQIAYRREKGRLVGQKSSDGRRIDIQYAGNRPKMITLEGQQRAAYDYYEDYWLARARGDREWSIVYDPSGRPSKITSPAATTLFLKHDEKGRLTSVESGPMNVGIEYLKGTNTVRLSSNGQPTMEWLLGPISGPVMPGRAVLLTRSIAGRILQVSKGPVTGTGFTRQFTPSETITLVR